MPILIDTVDFLDEFGNTTSFYKADAGDKITATFNIRASMKMTSVANPLTLDPSTNQIQSPGISWLDEGFRPGDTVLIYIHSSGGAVINTFWSQLFYVDDVLADFGGIPDWYSLTANEFVTMYVVVGPYTGTYITNSYARVERGGLDLLFNHVKNGNPGSEFSLIDAEVSKIQFLNLSLLPVGSSVNGTITGNQSGGFLLNAQVVHSAPTVGGFSFWQVVVEFVNPGMYDDGTWFFSSECLKIYSKMSWSRLSGEPYAKYDSIYNLQANTGGFNEPYNADVSDSVLVAGINELDYCVATTFDVIVDGPIVNLGIGAAYHSINDAYYRNQPQGQQDLAMIIATAPAIVGPVYISNLNPSFANYEIEINSINTVGTVTTLNITFTPAATFASFMDSVEDGDRLFKLWIKSGNINWLVFDSQLTCEPPVAGPLIIENEAAFLDHSSNWDPRANIEFPLPPEFITDIFDTEDDLSSITEFFLDKNQIYESLSVKIEAFNVTTGEDFTLQTYNYSFSGVQISADGKYLLDLSQPLNSELPNTSNKKLGFFELRTNDETPTQYLVRLYAPWILNWKYWFQQLNASVDFYPTQNKDWEQYDNVTDWQIRTEIGLIKEGLQYTHAKQIIDLEYNAEDNIISTIDLIDDATNNIVNVVPIGNLMRIKSTHTNLLGPWGRTTWGMITVESFESSPRWICSSIVDYDNNTANPLTPLAGLIIIIAYPSPDVVIMECYFDSNLIDLSNGIKITAKIKDNYETIVPCPGMLFENDDCILLENGNHLIIE